MCLVDMFNAELYLVGTEIPEGVLLGWGVGGRGDGYRNESAQKVDPGEENSPAAPAGT